MKKECNEVRKSMLHPDLTAFQRVATTGEGRGIEGAIERGIEEEWRRSAVGME